jgi:hypothetical protein
MVILTDILLHMQAIKSLTLHKYNVMNIWMFILLRACEVSV